MPGLVIAGTEVPVPGRIVTNFNDDPRLKAAREDGRKRPRTAVTMIVPHTTKGIWPMRICEDPSPDLGKELDVAKFWATSKRSSGTQLVIDTDGSIGCLADLKYWASYSIGIHLANMKSINIELYQLSDGTVYRDTINSAADVIDLLCTHQFLIQRQYCNVWRPGDRARRLELGGKDYTGVAGHRDFTHRRGRGDAGDEIGDELARRGFEGFDPYTRQDLVVWADRQKDLNEWARSAGREDLTVVEDGVAGLKTRRLLKARGFAFGQWTLGTVDDPSLVAAEPDCAKCCPVCCE